MIVDPPSLAGAAHDTVAEESPATADTPVGAPGTATGVTDPESRESAPSPTAFVAATAKVYGVPFDSPTTGHDRDTRLVMVQKNPPGVLVAV